jgi:nucleolar protein 6
MSRKRKHDQVESDAGAGAGNSQNSSSASAPAQPVDSTAQPPKSKGKSRQERSERRSKKQKKSKAEPSQTTKDDGDDYSTAQDEAATVPKDERAKEPDTAAAEGVAAEKKSKKAKKMKQSDTAAVEGAAIENENESQSHKAQKTGEQKESKTPSRFIVFVGNLPFDATAAQVKQHFSKLAPTSVRMSTDKATGRGKGFAFLEFDVYDKMKTCLKLYHHSIFDPTHKDGADAPDDKRKGRRINVELTAGGGGGKSKDRKAKIKTKNAKLEEERERQRIKDKADKERAARKNRGPPGTGANAEASEAPQDNRGAVHPSRLSRVQH